MTFERVRDTKRFLEPKLLRCLPNAGCPSIHKPILLEMLKADQFILELTPNYKSHPKDLLTAIYTLDFYKTGTGNRIYDLTYKDTWTAAIYLIILGELIRVQMAPMICRECSYQQTIPQDREFLPRMRSITCENVSDDDESMSTADTISESTASTTLYTANTTTTTPADSLSTSFFDCAII